MVKIGNLADKYCGPVYVKLVMLMATYLGLFLVIIMCDENIGGKPLTIQKLKDFNDCTAYFSLSDIRSNGNKWTWHNIVTRQKELLVD